MFVLLGIVTALYERERSGKGQVVDAAMVDGVSILSQMMWTMKSIGSMADERESFLLDGGAPFYRTYETADGRYMAVGAIEPQFFAQLLDRPGSGCRRGARTSSTSPPTRRCARSSPSGLRARPATNGPQIFAGTDACVTPVLTWTEAAQNEHLKARSTLVRRQRRRAGRAGAAVLPYPVRPGRRTAESHHADRPDRLVTRVSCPILCARPVGLLHLPMWP